VLEVVDGRNDHHGAAMPTTTGSAGIESLRRVHTTDRTRCATEHRIRLPYPLDHPDADRSGPLRFIGRGQRLRKA